MLWDFFLCFPIKKCEKSSADPRMTPDLTISTYERGMNFRIWRKKLQEHDMPTLQCMTMSRPLYHDMTTGNKRLTA